MTTSPPFQLPERHSEAHKGDFGRVCLIGGSRGMSGSIALSAIAALHSGAGLVTAVVPDRCLESVAGFHPAIMTIPLPDDSTGKFAMEAAACLGERMTKATAIGVGPGMTTEPGSVRMVKRLLAMNRTPRIFDADAINVIAAHRLLANAVELGPLVLTPHPGELQRLTGIAPDQRQAQIDAAGELAGRHEIVIVVKGGPTVVVGDDDCWTNSTGNPGMATAGSGDVLTGIITALVGQGLSPIDAARMGVWMHGRAGDIAAARYGQSAVTATRILECIGAVN